MENYQGRLDLETLKEQVGKRIKEAREKAGLKQTELATKTSVKAASISSYEKGNSLPSLNVAVEIANSCNVSVDWLCGTEHHNDSGKSNLSDLIEVLIDLGKYNIFSIEYHQKGRAFLDNNLERYARLSFLERSHTTTTEDNKHTYTAPYENNCDFFSFFKDWEKMYNLLTDGAIDTEVYQLWVEKTIKKYKNSPLPIDIPF